LIAISANRHFIYLQFSFVSKRLQFTGVLRLLDAIEVTDDDDDGDEWGGQQYAIKL